MKFLVFAAILVVGQATKLKVHVPKEAAGYLQNLNIDDVPTKITVHLNGINPSDVLPLLSEFSPQVSTDDEQVADEPAQHRSAHVKVHVRPVQEDASVQEDTPSDEETANKIRVHVHGANLEDIMSSLSNFAPAVAGGNDAPHIRIHLRPHIAEDETVKQDAFLHNTFIGAGNTDAYKLQGVGSATGEGTKASKNQLHDTIDNFLARMKQNDPVLHAIYTTDDRADEFEEERSVHDIAKEKFLADLKISTPTLHKVYMSLPADQQDAFLGDLFNGIGHAVKGVASIATGAVGLAAGAVHGAVKGVVDIGGHVVKGATEGCKSGILGCVGGALGGTVKGAGNVVVSTLGGAHKGAEIGLNILDKKKPTCAKDTIAACKGYAAGGRCTVNAAWTNYMRVACPTSCCGKIAAAPCKDKISCAAYQPYCNHATYVASMKVNCKKTCNFC